MRLPLLFFLSLFCCAAIYGQDQVHNIDEQLKQYNTDQEKLVFLDSITESKELARNPKQKIKYVKQTIRLARQLADYDIVAKKSRFILQDLNTRGLHDSVINLANVLIKEKEKFKDTKSLAHLYLKRAGAFYKQTKYQDAIIDYEAAAVIFEANDKILFAADSYFFAGQCYLLTNNYVTSITQMKKAMRLYDLGGDLTYVQYVTSSLADLYDGIGLTDEAFEERKKFLEKYRGKIPPYALSDCYEGISKYYFKKDQFDEQKIYLDSAYAEIPKIDDYDIKPFVSALGMTICNDYVDHYISTGNLENAESYLKKAEEYWQNSDSKDFYETSIFFSRAKVLEKKGQNTSASNLYKKILDKEFEVQNTWQRVYAQEGLAEILEKQGDYKNAIALRKEELKLRDSLDQIQQKSKLLLLQTEFETERRKKELAQRNIEIRNLELEQTVARNKRLVLLISLLLVAVIAAITVYLIWQRSKHRRQRLEQEVAYKKKDLKYFALEISQKREWALELVDKIKAIKNATGKKQSIALDHLNADIQNRIKVDEDTELLYDKVESLCSAFYDNLREKYPHLTKTDIRLCTLIRMNLSTKQIATLQNINPSSVKMSRSRLRKKLNLDSTEDINQFLSTF